MGFVRPNDRRPVGDRAETPICAAPFVAMEFDQFGDVQACCANALHPLGNVQRSTLDEIWHGEHARSIRAALLRGDLSYGCGVCRHRLEHRYGEMPRDYYDNFPFTSTEPEWPYSLQFSLHNTCNLACVMCGPDRSSRIRSLRSDLTALPRVYGDAFFEQLVPYLEHCGAADFSGGEPFLIPEHHRVWDLLADLDERPLCSLTTNGTQWNEGVERALDRLDFHIAVSIDGFTASTFEAIRVGARHDEVMANLMRFRRYTDERGTDLTITWSLLRHNWFELGDLLRFAEHHRIGVKVQTVIEPEHGVQRLPTDELRVVVESMEAESRHLEPDLGERNLVMWRREVDRLRDELERRGTGGATLRYMEPPSPDNGAHVASVAVSVGRPGRRPASVARSLVARLAGGAPGADAGAHTRARAELAQWAGGGQVGLVRLDADGRVREGDLAGVLPTGVDAVPMPLGGTLADVLAALEAVLDGVLWIGDEQVEPDRVHHMLWIGRPERDKAGVTLRSTAIASTSGVDWFVAADTRFLPVDADGRPVSLRTGGRRRPAAQPADRLPLRATS